MSVPCRVQLTAGWAIWHVLAKTLDVLIHAFRLHSVFHSMHFLCHYPTSLRVVVHKGEKSKGPQVLEPLVGYFT